MLSTVQNVLREMAGWALHGAEHYNSRQSYSTLQLTENQLA